MPTPIDRPDFAEISQTFQQAVVDVVGANSLPDPTYGPTFVGQAPSVSILMRAFTGAQNLRLTWAPDNPYSGGSIVRNYYLRAGEEAIFFQSVLAPYLTVQVLHHAGDPTATHDLAIFPSAVSGVPGCSVSSPTIATAFQSPGAGATITQAFTRWYIGPASVTVEYDGVVGHVVFKSQTLSGAGGSVFAQVGIYASLTRPSQVWVPGGINVMDMVNGDGVVRDFHVEVAGITL